jgi:hypothetical protein
MRDEEVKGKVPVFPEHREGGVGSDDAVEEGEHNEEEGKDVGYHSE